MELSKNFIKKILNEVSESIHQKKKMIFLKGIDTNLILEDTKFEERYTNNSEKVPSFFTNLKKQLRNTDESTS
jgi:hypothetical protein